MREVIETRWCDVCAAADGDEVIRVAATQTWTVGAVEGEKARPALKALDVCDAHAKEWMAPLAVFLGSTGQTPALPPERRATTATGRPVPPSAQPVDCRVCGRVVSTMGSLVAHVRKDHAGIVAAPSLPTTCPVCGFEAESAYGARMHRTATHGISALDDAYEAARAAGVKVKG